VHIFAAIATSNPDRRTFATLAGGLVLNALMLGLLVYAARGVMRGKRFGLAFGLLCFIGFGIVLAAVMAGRSYEATKALFCVQIGCIAVFAGTWILVVVAWVSQMQHRPGHFASEKH
jgi:hypothetical protein